MKIRQYWSEFVFTKGKSEKERKQGMTSIAKVHKSREGDTKSRLPPPLEKGEKVGRNDDLERGLKQEVLIDVNPK